LNVSPVGEPTAAVVTPGLDSLRFGSSAQDLECICGTGPFSPRDVVNLFSPLSSILGMPTSSTTPALPASSTLPPPSTLPTLSTLPTRSPTPCFFSTTCDRHYPLSPLREAGSTNPSIWSLTRSSPLRMLSRFSGLEGLNQSQVTRRSVNL
jgi:hypothetical protein